MASKKQILYFIFILKRGREDHCLRNLHFKYPKEKQQQLTVAYSFTV